MFRGLQVSQLSVCVDNNPIINNISLQCAPGSIHALMGPNGSGKSTLAYTLMGHPAYSVTQGAIYFQTKDLALLQPYERARNGIFLSFQQPYVLSGVTWLTFLYESYKSIVNSIITYSSFLEVVHNYCALLHIQTDVLDRVVNQGFSGGERKRFELLQVLLLKPQLVIFDEIDSGLDVDTLKLLPLVLDHLTKACPDRIILVITHYPRILELIVPEYIHVLKAGALIYSGAPTIVSLLEQGGYDAL